MIDKYRITQEAEHFFEWPTADRSQVTTTSMLIFVNTICEMQRMDELTKDTKLVKQCSTCSHWKIVAGFTPECWNPIVRVMIDVDPYAGFSFETKPAFGCNKWEKK